MDVEQRSIELSERLAWLVLLRCYSQRSQGFTEASLAKDLSGLYPPGEPTPQAVGQALARMAHNAWLNNSGTKFQLSTVGEQAVVDWLHGGSKTSKQPSWADIKSRYLPAKLMGLPAAVKWSRPAEWVRTSVLRHAFNLGGDPDKQPTEAAIKRGLMRQAFEQRFGLSPGLIKPNANPPQGDYAKILLSSYLGEPQTRMKPETVLRTLADNLLAMGGNPGEALISRWARGIEPLLPAAPPPADEGSAVAASDRAEPTADSAPTQPGDDDLTEFASRVRAAAAATPTGRPLNPQKVFISHVWQTMQRQGLDQSMDETEFKRRLVLANAKNLLQMTRADSPERLDPQDVQASATSEAGYNFHFIVT